MVHFSRQGNTGNLTKSIENLFLHREFSSQHKENFEFSKMKGCIPWLWWDEVTIFWLFSKFSVGNLGNGISLLLLQFKRGLQIIYLSWIAVE